MCRASGLNKYRLRSLYQQLLSSHAIYFSSRIEKLVVLIPKDYLSLPKIEGISSLFLAIMALLEAEGWNNSYLGMIEGGNKNGVRK